MCMIDVTDIEGVSLGDSVTIFGEKPTAGDLAKQLGTIPYEIFTSVARRVQKVIIHEDGTIGKAFGLCSHETQIEKL